MKNNTKVSQDKKVPMDAKTQQTKNNSSNKEDNKNDVRSSAKEDNKKDVREDRLNVDVHTKAPKTAEKANPEKVKTSFGL